MFVTINTLPLVLVMLYAKLITCQAPGIYLDGSALFITPANGSCVFPDTLAVTLGSCRVEHVLNTCMFINPISACNFTEDKPEDFVAPLIITCTAPDGSFSASEFYLHLALISEGSVVPPSHQPALSPSPTPASSGTTGVNLGMIAGIVGGAAAVAVAAAAVAVYRDRKRRITPDIKV